MFLPYLYSIALMWYLMFHPEIINLMPGTGAIKPIIFAVFAIGIWCVLALKSMERDY